MNGDACESLKLDGGDGRGIGAPRRNVVPVPPPTPSLPAAATAAEEAFDGDSAVMAAADDGDMPL